MNIRNILAGMLVVGIVGLADRAALAQWSKVNPTASNAAISTFMLLSDGSVMGQVSGGTGWQRLIPTNSGSYSSGTWTNNINPMTYTRTYFASDILQNGNMFVGGGEDGNGSDYVEIYNPVANSWTDYGPAPFGGMADAESELLDNGQVLVDPQALTSGDDTYRFNPSSGTWSGGIKPLGNQAESSWVKLPDNSILTVDSDGSGNGSENAERYVPSLGAWTNAGTLPVSVWADLELTPVVAETGPAFLLPNGNAIFFGGNGNTAIYRPSSGTWIQGPSIPNGQVMGDSPGAMMPNGKILLCVGPPLLNNASTNNPIWVTPISFYEFDYSDQSQSPNGSYTQVFAPGNSSYTLTNDIQYPCRMLVLPSGNVLFTDGNQQLGKTLYIYQMDSPALAASQPAINNFQWNSDGSLLVTGTLFDGISEGAGYGDDQQMATDFPLVTFSSGGNVYYGRTYNWSSTSVQTGGQVMTTDVTIPPEVFDFPGEWSLQVVANGSASAPVSFYSPVWVDFVNYVSGFEFGWYPFPYATLPQGVSGVASGGTIAIDASSQPSKGAVSVPYTISTPMTIISVFGPSTIGN